MCYLIVARTQQFRSIFNMKHDSFRFKNRVLTKDPVLTMTDRAHVQMWERRKPSKHCNVALLRKLPTWSHCNWRQGRKHDIVEREKYDSASSSLYRTHWYYNVYFHGDP